MKKPVSIEQLRALANQGDAKAQYFLAAQLSAKGNKEEADRWLHSAADLGEPDAIYTMATRLLQSSAGVSEATSLLRNAAVQGSLAAMRLLAVLIADASASPDGWNEALDLVKEASTRGDRIAKQELSILDAELDFGNAIADWISTANQDTERLCESPDVVVVKNAFSKALCTHVMQASKRMLRPSQVFDPRTGQSVKDQYRNSLNATLGPVDLDLPLVMFNRRLAHLSGIAHAQAEHLSVLNYHPGQEYKPHFDWIPKGADFDRGGQRITTALVYLNDAYSGGETRFLSPGLDFRGEVGDALIFRNVLEDGSPDKASRHASLPVRSGEKWLASKWFREREYHY